MRFVLSLGGSLLVPKDIDVEYIKKFKELIMNSEHTFYIIVGGGNIARQYATAAKDIADVSNEQQDFIGIQATKLNAELILQILGDVCYEKVVNDPSVKIETDKRIIIGCGSKPGHSSDMDAVIMAETEDADTVVNLTNVDYVYDKDPKEGGAHAIKNLTFDEYKKVIGGEWVSGMHAPFDPIAAKEAQAKGKKIIIINGNNLGNLKNFFDGKEFEGSIIQ